MQNWTSYENPKKYFYPVTLLIKISYNGRWDVAIPHGNWSSTVYRDLLIIVSPSSHSAQPKKERIIHVFVIDFLQAWINCVDFKIIRTHEKLSGDVLQNEPYIYNRSFQTTTKHNKVQIVCIFIGMYFILCQMDGVLSYAVLNVFPGLIFHALWRCIKIVRCCAYEYGGSEGTC